MLEEQRENWGTRTGFVLAAVGSAVGLGNLWGFPYKLYTYGGGAFLIPYITAMFCIGIPMLILEFSMGHFTQRAAPDAYRRCNRRFEFVGWWSIIMGFVIITYYPIILAYCFSFLYHSLVGIFNGGELPWAAPGLEGVQKAEEFFYNNYLGYRESFELGAMRWNIAGPLVLAWTAMYLCIFKGVKLVDKIVWFTVPLPWLMLFILAVRGLTLPGSMEGLVYYLEPNWQQLGEPTTWRFAFGQVFFSLSLAFGVMITYSSFLHRKSDINNNAAIIGISDFATSFIAGIAIFATIGGMAFVTAQAGTPVAVDKVVSGGPGLAFVAFPYALAQLPGSAWWSFIFFFTLVTLGIDSAFSITESVLAGIVDKTGWKRWKVLPIMSLVGLGFGLFYVTEGGLNWLGTVDGFINGTWGIAFLGLLECVVLGWLYRVELLREHANERSDWRLGTWWNLVIRIVIPLVLGTLFFWNLIDDFSAEGGFLRSPEGGWIVPNCVGMGIVIAAPVLGIIMSLVKTVKHDDEPAGGSDILSSLKPSQSALGKVALGLAVVGATVLLFGLKDGPGRLSPAVLAFCAGLGFAGVIISNALIDRGDKLLLRPSWFTKWSGVVSVMVMSLAAAVFLNEQVLKGQGETAEHVYPEALGMTSYIILAVVAVLIFGGLGWCFYKAIAAAGEEAQEE